MFPRAYARGGRPSVPEECLHHPGRIPGEPVVAAREANELHARRQAIDREKRQREARRAGGGAWRLVDRVARRFETERRRPGRGQRDEAVRKPGGYHEAVPQALTPGKAEAVIVDRKGFAPPQIALDLVAEHVDRKSVV